MLPQFHAAITALSTLVGPISMASTRFPHRLPESCSSAITKIINVDALMVTDVSFIKATRREAYTTATS